MKQDVRLLFGPLAAVILALGIVGLATMVPGYSQVRQTVSEIGEIGSPARVPFAIMLCAVGACLLVFAWGVRGRAIEAGHNTLVAYFIAFGAVPAVGIGVFAYPHPLHNFFGLSELVNYQAPLVFALTWRGDAAARNLVRVSWIMFALVWCAIGVNLVSFDRHGALWEALRPVYGLAQRSLFAAWFGWCAIVGLMLFQANGLTIADRGTALGAPAPPAFTQPDG